jgi:hypothetical protein
VKEGKHKHDWYAWLTYGCRREPSKSDATSIV